MADKESLEPRMLETEGTPSEIRRSDRYVNIYTNQVETGFSPWDIQLSLMQVHGRSADVIGEELATVTMSPQHAKALIFPLMKTIIQYEEQHGVITMPTSKASVSLFDMVRSTIQQAVEKAEEMAKARDEEKAE